MVIIPIVFLLIMIFVVAYAIQDIRRKEKEYIKLKKIYRDREEREKRKIKLITEKPDYAIFLSELQNTKVSFRFIGSFKKLPEGIFDTHTKDTYCIALVNGINYLYKDDKWYELVDDISHLRDIEKWH